LSLQQARNELRRLQFLNFISPTVSGSLLGTGAPTARESQLTDANNRIARIEEQGFARGAEQNLLREELFQSYGNSVKHVERVLPRVRRESSRVKRNTGRVTPQVDNPFGPT